MAVGSSKSAMTTSIGSPASRSRPAAERTIARTGTPRLLSNSTSGLPVLPVAPVTSTISVVIWTSRLSESARWRSAAQGTPVSHLAQTVFAVPMVWPESRELPPGLTTSRRP